ncbi:MAG: TolB family protein [Planctomycetota bacterium]|jgi:Tol biopolymer transport system component
MRLLRYTFALPLLLSACASSEDSIAAEAPTIQYLATASQVGPVGYRDPVGAPSPNGEWLAYCDGRELWAQPLEGGGRRLLGRTPSPVRYLTWLPDSSAIMVHERSFDRGSNTWRILPLDGSAPRELWDGRPPSNPDAPKASELWEISFNRDGTRMVGARREGGRSEVWVYAADGSQATRAGRGVMLSYPVFLPSGEVGCIARLDDDQYFYAFGGTEVRRIGRGQSFGHAAFLPDESMVHATPNAEGVLELWQLFPNGNHSTRRLAGFARDAYAPSVLPDGRVVFKTQDYRVNIASVPAEGGSTSPLTTFQSETPSWSWDGKQVAFTFGGWRIASDDIAYPDISQHIGTVSFSEATMASEPHKIVRQSYSEDQGMHWSPNGKWITYHSHIDGSDDIYLVLADGSMPPVRISQAGHETGWPRWSANGQHILYPSYERNEQGARSGSLYLIEIDQETGESQAERKIPLQDFGFDCLQAEWADEGEQIIFEAAEGAGKKALYSVARTGGRPQRIHGWESDQVHSGIAVSADSEWIAYIGPAKDGVFQVFRVPLAGGEPEQLTFDPSDKTHPAYSPLGDRLAFTVFSYQAHFWAMQL